MENRKFLIFTIPILLLGFFVFCSEKVFAYGVETHGFLTKEIVDFYNKHFPKNKISEELGSYLVDGARLEDNVPRYFNHFYDPINNRGLEDKIYHGMASKIWAQDEKEQLALIYRILPQTEIPIFLTASQIQKIKPEFDQSDFTWQKAIDLYAKGEKERALFALGHTLHLIEDASVPDHTRNDSHPPFDDGGSPYENWTGKFDLKNPDLNLKTRLTSKKPIFLDTLDKYFDGIANYSNNNFYSKDSISKYNFPKPDYVEQKGAFVYAFKKDGNDVYPLSLVKNYSGRYEWRESELLLPHSAQDLIMPDYWNRLSVKAVQHGAGVIDLFFKEAEAAREKYLTAKAQRPYLATLIDGVSTIFGGQDPKDPTDLVNELKLVGEIPIEQSKTNETNKTDQKNNIPTEIISLQLQSVDTPAIPVVVSEPEKPKAPEKICSFNTSQLPSYQKIIINEIAWMGTIASHSNEWVELKNISAESIDLSGWQLVDLREQIKVQLGGSLPAGGLYLLERTDDSTVPGVAADKIFTGAIANYDEGLRLFDRDCNLTDEIFAKPDWPAGATDPKRTAERGLNLKWHSASIDGGTPKAENSLPAVPIPPTTGVSQSSNSNSTIPPISVSNTEPVKVLISEVLFDADGTDDGKEFIELYNPNDQILDLSGWSIQHVSASGSITKKNFESGNTIAPKSFFLIWLGSDPRADLVWASGSLGNASSTIYLVSSTTAVSTSAPEFIDSFGYNVAELAGFSAGKSLERKSYSGGNCISPQEGNEYAGNGCDTGTYQTDLELREIPNPQNRQSLPEPRSAPAAVNNFQISYSSTTSELFFTWEAANGADKYHLVDVATTTSTNALKNITETGQEYKFEIYSVDNDGYYSSSTETSIFVEASVGGDTVSPLPAPVGLSNILFGHDSGGNYIGFTLNDTNIDDNAIHYIIVWLNEPPLPLDPANRFSGLGSDWAWKCQSSGIIQDADFNLRHGFESYVMANYQFGWDSVRPPIYQLTEAPYQYKVYFSPSCPEEAVYHGRDLKTDLIADDYIHVSLWIYYPQFLGMNARDSKDYGPFYFQP